MDDGRQADPYMFLNDCIIYVEDNMPFVSIYRYVCTCIYKIVLIQFLCKSKYNIVSLLTRLLGRPQPQMYPLVTLNQYTWVNRTRKHFI